MHIVFINGFNSSPNSFNYIVEKLPEHDRTLVQYDSHQSLLLSINEIAAQLPSEKFCIVGHSLGGLLAVLIASTNPLVQRIVTVSSPLGGSKAAAALRWIPGYPSLMHDITPSSPFIKRVAELKLRIPTLCVVSTGGSLQTTSEPNDSIVTVASQKALKFGRKVEVKANHFEILLHNDTIKHIHTHIFKDNKNENKIEADE